MISKMGRNRNEIALRPSDIRYTQNSISNKFSDGTLIGMLLDDIVFGRCFVSGIKMIQVMCADGVWYSADNRRLWVFKQLELLGHCPLVMVKVVRQINWAKCTSKNGGIKVSIRGGQPGGICYTLAEEMRQKLKTYYSLLEENYSLLQERTNCKSSVNIRKKKRRADKRKRRRRRKQNKETELLMKQDKVLPYCNVQSDNQRSIPCRKDTDIESFITHSKADEPSLVLPHQHAETVQKIPYEINVTGAIQCNEAGDDDDDDDDEEEEEEDDDDDDACDYTNDYYQYNVADSDDCKDESNDNIDTDFNFGSSHHDYDSAHNSGPNRHFRSTLEKERLTPRPSVSTLHKGGNRSNTKPQLCESKKEHVKLYTFQGSESVDNLRMKENELRFIRYQMELMNVHDISEKEKANNGCCNIL